MIAFNAKTGKFDLDQRLRALDRGQVLRLIAECSDALVAAPVTPPKRPVARRAKKR